MSKSVHLIYAEPVHFEDYLAFAPMWRDQIANVRIHETVRPDHLDRVALPLPSSSDVRSALPWPFPGFSRLAPGNIKPSHTLKWGEGIAFQPQEPRMDTFVSDAQTWAMTPFATTDLHDERRTKRLVLLATQIAADPSGSFPQQTESWNDLRAAYNLFDCEDVTFQAIASQAG